MEGATFLCEELLQFVHYRGKLYLILIEVIHKILNFMNVKHKTLNSVSSNTRLLSPQSLTSKESNTMFQNLYTIPNQIKGLSVSKSSNI